MLCESTDRSAQHVPRVSVVIPSYNRADTLSSAISTVLCQTFQDFEIIIVDDASNDNTKEVVCAIGDCRIKYLRHDTNKREAGARNTGVRNSSGEYIAFLDDDDEWLPDKLERQVKLLDSSSPRVGAVYTGSFRVDGATGRTLGQYVPTKRGDILEDLSFKNWVGTPSTVMLRRECFERVGLFDSAIVFGPDYDMWIRMAAKYHFECIQEPLIKYYIHSERLSSNYELMITGIEAQMRKHESLFALNSRGYSRRYFVLGVYHCCNGNVKKGREEFVKAIKLYPFEVRHYYCFALSLLGADTFRRLRSV